jgi:hypothetical protein
MSLKVSICHQGLRVVSCRVILDVPGELVAYACRGCWLAAHRREIGPWEGTRRLVCCYQALFVLAWFRDKRDIRRLGAGFGLGRCVAYRYLSEGIDVLAAQAPDLREALVHAVEDGLSYLTWTGRSSSPTGAC